MEHTPDRTDEVRGALDAMHDTVVQDEYNTLHGLMGMLITDALLARDREALRTAHDGLRRLYGQQGDGRYLGQIDITYWALRRLP